ncbi:MAG: AAA family ATPase [Clostridia bacterium]|nr:AAA family ATPase [Clostridia bacterium]
MLKKKGFPLIAAAVAVALIVAVLFENKEGKGESVAYPVFARAIEEGAIETVYYSDDAQWTAIAKDGTRITVPNPRNDSMKEHMMLNGIHVVEKQGQEMLPMLIFMILMAMMIFGRRSGMETYSGTDAEKTAPKRTFADVIIPKETLQAMEDLTCYLKNPGKYAAMGARPPRGVLLYGPPGTGKTMLAQALAGETGKPFFAVSGSDFVQVYVGVGASRIRSLFKKARKAGGGVIFIDEIEALGKKRDNGNDEREQTLNALLTEMNGFSAGEGIIVLAATNRPDTLDGALMREGRFDRRIEIGLPDLEERRKMLSVHARNKPLAADVNLDEMAGKTVLFSGAQLESMMNEAAIRAIREGKELIFQRHLEQAYIAQAAGEERRRKMEEEERRIIAVHEAGHALVTHHLLPEQTLTRLTIIPSSTGAAGYSLSIRKERMLYTKKELMHHLAAILAGRAAEETVFGLDNVTNGAGSDLEKAEKMAVQMYLWRMLEAENEKAAVTMVLTEGKRLAMDVLEREKDTLEMISRTLMEKETLTGEELQKILAGK